MEIDDQTVEYIGENDGFFIRYLLIKNDPNFAFCHLFLNGQIIGDQNEACYLVTWLSSMRNVKERIADNSKLLYHREFFNRNDQELFELILKSNELKKDFNIEYDYLPVLENEVWNNCHISIDETTDAYLIMMLEIDDKIKFLWKGWRQPCAIDKISRLYSVVIGKKVIIETIEKVLSKLQPSNN